MSFLSENETIFFKHCKYIVNGLSIDTREFLSIYLSMRFLFCIIDEIKCETHILFCLSNVNPLCIRILFWGLSHLLVSYPEHLLELTHNIVFIFSLSLSLALSRTSNISRSKCFLPSGKRQIIRVERRDGMLFVINDD